MAQPERLIDPGQINIMSGYLNGFISSMEEEINEQNYIVSLKWSDIRKVLKSNAESDRELELTDEYRNREKAKILLGRLKRFRADLKDRFIVLTNLKRY